MASSKLFLCYLLSTFLLLLQGATSFGPPRQYVPARLIHVYPPANRCNGCTQPASSSSALRGMTTSSTETDDILSRITYRASTPADIPACLEIESASYPADEAATLNSLTYRQAAAGRYFRCAILDQASKQPQIVGYICSTRCDHFHEESMSTHAPSGSLLAIHSVVVQEEYRRKGIASAMLREYVRMIEEDDGDGDANPDGTGIQSMVLLAKNYLLGFYVNCGFQVIRPSAIVHGQEQWFDLERRLVVSKEEEEKWFCKTEQFKRPFPEVKPYLEAHKEWVVSLRRAGTCITSGYRVDAEGKPGGGGLLFVAATNYEEALKLVLQDPLVANDCVDWELNGWIGQVGDIRMR